MIQSQALRDWSGMISSRRDGLGLSTQAVYASITNYAQREGVNPPSLETVGNWFLGLERPKEMYLQALYEALQIDVEKAAKDMAVQIETAEEAEAIRRFRSWSPAQREAELLAWKAREGK